MRQPAPSRWQRRPVHAAVVRGLAFAVPVAAAIGASVAVSRVLPTPSATLAQAAWWGVLFAVSGLVLTGLEGVRRRLLPLAALFELSLVFPDRAPSRFGVALRAGTVRQLERRVERARRDGLNQEPAHAAATVLELVAGLSAHDRRTRGHSERVRALTDLLAEEMRLPEADRERLRWSALLHDIGKLAVSHAVLAKPDAPTDEEWALLRSHPLEGERLVAPLAAWLGDWTLAVGEHHEKWDGTGYPRELAGEEISLAARIVAVADCFEVMTAQRSYRRPVSPKAARRELTKCAGSHFDPVIVRAFLNISIGRLRRVMGPASWLAQIPLVGRAPIGPTLGSAAAGVAATGAFLTGGLLPSDTPAAQALNPDRGSEAATATGEDVDAPGTGGSDASPSPADAPVGSGDRTTRSPAEQTSPVPGASTTTTSVPRGVTTTSSPTTTTTAPGTTTITALPLNLPPLALADAAFTSVGAWVNIAVTANDTDADGDALSISSFGQGLNGSVVQVGPGTLRYQPAPLFVGVDTFMYTVTDARGGYATALVTVTVTL